MKGSNASTWQIKKISWLFKTIGSGTTPNSQEQSYYDGDIPWINTGDLKDKEIRTVTNTISRKALIDYSSLRLFPENSLVIALYGATIGKLGILTFPATTNQACCVLSHPHSEVDVKFIYYWFLGHRRDIVALSLGGGQPNIMSPLTFFDGRRVAICYVH
jgi:type I restriction enzyme S subunit